jgi:Tfp pilus assembly protein PilN
VSLRTNLATRPFYNVRAVHASIIALAVVVLGLTLFNAVELVRLTASQRTLGARAADAEGEADRLRGEAARIRTQINQKELEVVASAAREANSIIDRRAFSWTELLQQLEATLPDDVRITTVQPRLDRNVFKVGIVAEARQAEDIAAFIEALEKTGAFRNVVPLEQQTDEGGLIQVAIEGEYRAQTPRGETSE